MNDKPTKQEKLDACSRYDTSEFVNRKWDWKAPVPETCNDNWDARSWVKWVDSHGTWVKRGDGEQ